MNKNLAIIKLLIKTYQKNPGIFMQSVKLLPYICSSCAFTKSYEEKASKKSIEKTKEINPLWEYFQKYSTGPGIWKWEHYFDIYHSHLKKFIGHKISIVEIGIYSGGSMGMWKAYFGNGCHVYGVDIEEACKSYENESTTVFIGDQEKREFWGDFRKKVQGIDIIIDDGGHTPDQQRVTLEEMLPHLNFGGVYVCEDIHSTFNQFAAYASSLVHDLNYMNDLEDSSFQKAIYSIHFYPYVVVIEKHAMMPNKLIAPKHGTEWQPFL